MRQLVDLVLKQEDLLDSLESPEFLNGNKEISRLLQQFKEKDELIGSTLRILATLRYFPMEELSLRLKVKLYVISKYKINNSNHKMKELLKLVEQKDRLFSLENLNFKEPNKKFYFSENIVGWAEELYYLFGRVVENDQQIYDIIKVLDSARVSVIPNLIEDLVPKLELFLENQNKYSIR